jgi:O-antigen/teichoic acid export membrane protein
VSSAAAEPSGWWRRGLAILLARGGDTLLRVAIFPATALVLTGADFSRYALLTAALATGQTVFALGAPRAAMFFHRRGERGSLFGWLLLLAAAPCALAAGIFLAWPQLRIFWFGSVPPRLFWIGLSPLPFLLLADSLSATLLAAGRERLYSFFLWGRTLSSGLVLLTSLVSADRLEWVLGGRLAVNAAAAAGLALVAGARPRWSAVSGLAGPALRFGAPVALAGLLMAVHRRADVFLLSGLGRAEEIGAYALAYALAESLWILTDSLEAGLFVEISGRSAPEARAIAAAALRRFRLLALGALAAILLGGEAVLLLFFRGRYPSAPVLLPAVALGTAAWGSARPAASFLYAGGRARTLAACHVGALAANLALCAAAIPHWGALGAAGASLVSYSLLTVLVLRAFRREDESTAGI